MPKIVDHDVRRREIVEAYIRVAAREGLHGVTSRAVASELGIAVGGLWHYFDSLEAVLSAAYERIYARQTDRIDEGVEGLRGLAAAKAMVRALLPLTTTTQLEARINVSYWGYIASRAELSRIQAQLEIDWTRRMCDYIQGAVEDGRLKASTPVMLLAQQLLLLTSALQVEFVVSSSLSAPERQLEILDLTIAPWLTD
ncbi:TetR/AcrR family transcriptional regulator [Georgenia ruanii]|uniref:TetR/AcrR family transcriptional regulator n=1 Tax=Georgenia ruanii TaxID=348442 RepID=UPI00186B1C90|nr:TetR family transcriptional regulator C-terminal domain-containing protein [Georgenia ruanii]